MTTTFILLLVTAFSIFTAGWYFEKAYRYLRELNEKNRDLKPEEIIEFCREREAMWREAVRQRETDPGTDQFHSVNTCYSRALEAMYIANCTEECMRKLRGG